MGADVLEQFLKEQTAKRKGEYPDETPPDRKATISAAWKVSCASFTEKGTMRNGREPIPPRFDAEESS